MKFEIGSHEDIDRYEKDIMESFFLSEKCINLIDEMYREGDVSSLFFERYLESTIQLWLQSNVNLKDFDLIWELLSRMKKYFKENSVIYLLLKI